MRTVVYALAAAAAFLIVWPGNAQAIDIVIQLQDEGENPPYDPSGGRLRNMALWAAALWEGYLPQSGTYELDLSWETTPFEGFPPDFPGYFSFDVGDSNIVVNPYIGTGSNYGWFIDSTPGAHSEFDFSIPQREPNGAGGWTYTGGQWTYRDIDSSTQSAWFGGNPPDLMEIGYRGISSDPTIAGERDLFTMLLHWIGQEIGNSDEQWEAQPNWVNGQNAVFVKNGIYVAAIPFRWEYVYYPPPLIS